MLDSLFSLAGKRSGSSEEIAGFSFTKVLRKPTMLIPMFGIGYIVVKKPSTETFKSLVKSPWLWALTLLTVGIQFVKGTGVNLPDAVTMAKNLIKGRGFKPLPKGGILSGLLASTGTGASSSGGLPYSGEKRTVADALKKSASEYGVEYARLIEKAVINETANFKSGQWLACNTPGMEAQSKEYPYGWSSLRRYVVENGLNEDHFYLKQFTDNHDGRDVHFVGFPTQFHAIDFMSWFLQDVRGGNVYAWNGLTQSKQDEYKRRIDPIKTTIV